MNRSERRSAMERRVGLAPPEECEERAFLRTLLEASACGLLKGGAEREYLEDIRDMINLRLAFIGEKS